MTKSENFINGVFYREVNVEKSSIVILLLHGKRFSSKNWDEIGTLGETKPSMYYLYTN